MLVKFSPWAPRPILGQFITPAQARGLHNCTVATGTITIIYCGMDWQCLTAVPCDAVITHSLLLWQVGAHLCTTETVKGTGPATDREARSGIWGGGVNCIGEEDGCVVQHSMLHACVSLKTFACIITLWIYSPNRCEWFAFFSWNMVFNC